MFCKMHYPSSFRENEICEEAKNENAHVNQEHASKWIIKEQNKMMLAAGRSI